jgi:hypothetical protein
MREAMNLRRTGGALVLILLGLAWLAVPADLTSQTQKKEPEKKEPERKGPPFGPGGPGGFRPGGPGGFGGPMGQVRQLVKQFDKDGDGRLNKEERKAAREFLKKERPGGRGGFGPGRPGGFGPGRPGGFGPGRPGGFGPPGPGGPGGFGRGNRDPAKPGPKVKPADVQVYTKESLYDPGVLRTFFLEFEDKDWEEEMADFYHTDVEVPATLIVDGKRYPNVGVRFRGLSSFMMAGAGYKRSLNVSLDFVDRKQRLYGYKTLNLLNSADDPSFMHTVLYSQICRDYIAAPKANYAKVAINGESWGLYVNAQQFNKEFTQEFFKSSKGARWKVPGNPGARGGLEYLGEDLSAYKTRFRMKSKDSDKSWKALVKLCRALNKTPPDQLEKALAPILDIDGVLWFLALDNALINDDGYWTRASDYSIYMDPKGKFHIIPHDMNETFALARGFRFGGPGRPGGGGGPADDRGSGLELNPLVGLNDTRMPLRSRLLGVPALKERYLKYVRTIAEKQLDWKKMGPTVAGYRKLIEKAVEADTRKLYTLAAFRKATADSVETEEGPFRGREVSLRAFAEGRRKFLLNYPGSKAEEARKP